MKIKLIILGILFAQVLTAQELTMKLSDEQIKNLDIRESLRLLSATNQIYLDDSSEQETIIDTVDMYATVIDWNKKTVHQTFLKEVRKGHKQWQIVPCPDRKYTSNGVGITCDVLHTSEVTVWDERDHYFAMGLSGEWIKVPDSYDVRNIIYKPENNDQ